jgi:hypothetical protein
MDEIELDLQTQLNNVIPENIDADQQYTKMTSVKGLSVHNL